MNEIDWSKAPEGATHRGAINWFKSDGEKVYTFDGAVWHPASWEIWQLAPFAKRPSIHADEWSGEGLPPVGVACEASIPHTSGPNNERSFIWIEGRVIAYHEIKGRQYAWFAEDDDGFYPPGVFEFRPIRTTEQIAADEREKGIAALLAAAGVTGSAFADDPEAIEWAAALYDAGYRKP